MKKNITIRRRVIGGQCRGKTLHYPTANLQLYPRDKIKRGVWAAKVGIAGRKYLGIVYVGAPVTFDDQVEKIEVYIFNYRGCLYGKIIQVSLVKWLRGVRKFSGKEELVKQIREDCNEVVGFR